MRSLKFDVFGDLSHGPVPPEIRREIANVQQRMNHDFTWTNETPTLELFEHCQITYAAPMPRPYAARLGTGIAAVHYDQWNALLVVRFLRWVSTKLPPGSYIRLQDDGSYVILQSVRLVRGEFRLGADDIARLSRHPHDPRALERRISRATRGRWVHAVAAAIYYEGRPEIAAIAHAMEPMAFKMLSLEDVADRIVFPWQSDEHNAV